MALLYLVVLAGAVVRTTGSGMGCPDWPKCYGRLIPPTEVSQIPPEMMADFLDPKKGNGNLAHTWVEFINRIFGGLSGLAMLLTCILSFRWLKRLPTVPLSLVGSGIVMATVIWLGKVVVDTNLAPHKVTIHLIGGLLVICGAIYARVTLHVAEKLPVTGTLRGHLWIALLLTLLQICMGAQIRETVDALSSGDCCAGRVESQLGVWYWPHRVGAILMVAVVGLLYFRLRGQGLHTAMPMLTRMTAIFLGGAYIVGVLLVRFQLTAWLKPAHLVCASGLLGVLVALLVATRPVPGPDTDLKIGAEADTLPSPAA